MSLLHLAWKYVRSRSLLAMSSLAIALGVAVVFTVQSVVNGYLVEVERTLREHTGDVVVHPFPKQFENPATLDDFLDALRPLNSVAQFEPRLNWFGLIGRSGSATHADPRSPDLTGMLLIGTDDIPLGTIRLGEASSKRLACKVGDRLEAVSFRTGSSGKPTISSRDFQAGPTFTTGRWDMDMDRALVSREDLSGLTQHSLGWSEILLRGKPGVEPDELASQALEALKTAGLTGPFSGQVTTWRDAGGNFLRAVESQKGILQTVFFLVVLVAAYQLIATLTLTVSEKRRDIGVLGALGATPNRIVSFFMFLGLLVAGLGSLFGILLGYWLTNNLRTVESWLSGGEPLFTAEVYKFEEIPISVEPLSVFMLVGATLLTALLFSFLPAWRAARLPVIRAIWRR
ncbi:MAG: FtsX-like permease family protein [Planctomycetota bacterium]|nr:FtsX-like permease family protein [Planctomycetota bacterium]